MLMFSMLVFHTLLQRTKKYELIYKEKVWVHTLQFCCSTLWGKQDKYYYPILQKRKLSLGRLKDFNFIRDENLGLENTNPEF